MANCIKGQKMNDYFTIQQEPTPTFCPPTISEDEVVKIVVEKVVQECLDVECLTQDVPLADLVCPMGTEFSSIISAEVVDFTITSTIIAPGLVSVNKLVNIRLTYLCDSQVQTKDVPVMSTRVLPVPGVEAGPGAELKTVVKVQFLGFDVVDNDLRLFVGVFVVVKFTRLIDLCVNAVLQSVKPPRCVGASPCDDFLSEDNLDAIWNELQGIE